MGDTMSADAAFETHGAAEKKAALSKKTIETLLADLLKIFLQKID